MLLPAQHWVGLLSWLREVVSFQKEVRDVVVVHTYHKLLESNRLSRQKCWDMFLNWGVFPETAFWIRRNGGRRSRRTAAFSLNSILSIWKWIVRNRTIGHLQFHYLCEAWDQRIFGWMDDWIGSACWLTWARFPRYCHKWCSKYQKGWTLYGFLC